ncbi:MAG TPA: cation-transporting ATPase [Methylococcus sp.]|nr:cation-transporting ATPase [Methylococcus sp.]
MVESVSFGADWVRIKDPSVFGVGNETLAAAFTQRVFRLPEVQSVTLEPAQATATVVYRVPRSDLANFRMRLTETVGDSEPRAEDLPLPSWVFGERVTFHRWQDRISAWRIERVGKSGLELHHPTLIGNARLAGRLDTTLRRQHGITRIRTTVSTGTVRVHFDSRRIEPREVVQVAEASLATSAMVEPPVPLPESVDFRVANTSVGLSAVGELLLPLATPAAASFLVIANAGLLGDAVRQLGRGKLGVPVFHTALLACSIATGQVLAYALTDWSLRYWQQRWRQTVARATQTLIEENFPRPSQVTVLNPDGEHAVPTPQLRPGDRIRVRQSEPVPADARVIGGVALVEETSVRGLPLPVRKSAGDEILAGSRVIVGTLEAEVERTGVETRAARLSAMLLRATSQLPREPALQKKAEDLATRTVPPTLATAGVGLALGDLITVGAILHQDWVSGPALALPMQILRDMRQALRRGVVVRSGTALARLAESDFLVLDGDHPALLTPRLELADFHTQLADLDTLLARAAAAALYLGDDRTTALTRACRERGLVVHEPELLGFDLGSTSVRIGKHRVDLIGPPTRSSRPTEALSLWIDGVETARLQFRFATPLPATELVTHWRARGLQVFVASSRPDAETWELARRLGADLAGGGLGPAQKLRFLTGLKKRGLHPAWLGDCRANPELAREAQVAVGFADAAGPGGEAAELVILGESPDPLVELLGLGRALESNIVAACRMATVPNLLCIAGAFGGLLNGITSGMLANLGVLNVDRRMRQIIEPGENERIGSERLLLRRAAVSSPHPS